VGPWPPVSSRTVPAVLLWWMRGCLFLQVITDSLSRQCKCHGVSGSCSMKTCFRSLPFDMFPVAQQLRNRYSVAVHVDPRSGVRQQTSSRGTDRTVRRRRRHRHRETSSSRVDGSYKFIIRLLTITITILMCTEKLTSLLHATGNEN